MNDYESLKKAVHKVAEAKKTLEAAEARVWALVGVSTPNAGGIFEKGVFDADFPSPLPEPLSDEEAAEAQADYDKMNKENAKALALAKEQQKQGQAALSDPA